MTSEIKALMEECALDAEEAEFLLTLPPEAVYLVREEVAFIGCKHPHDWPIGKVDPCKGQPHENVLCLNMNDTFCYACGDCEDVEPEQCAEVADIYKRFGDDGLTCWAAKRRNENPLIEIMERPQYQEAWKALYGDLKLRDNVCNKSCPRW